MEHFRKWKDAGKNCIDPIALQGIVLRAWKCDPSIYDHYMFTWLSSPINILIDIAVFIIRHPIPSIVTSWFHDNKRIVSL
jgi:hypothetical protein